MNKIENLVDICIDCNNPIMKSDRHMSIPQGEVYNNIEAIDGDIIIYQCSNCKSKLYTTK